MFSPGSDFYQTALSYAYKLGKDSSLISTNDIGNIYDYSGYRNLAMYSKWQELSRTASTASQIVNLM